MYKKIWFHIYISDLYCICLEKKRRVDRLQHLIRVKDPIIKKYWPNSLNQKEWENDLADVVVETAYHSDELSETDIKLARQEQSKKKRSYNDDDNN